MLLALWPIGRPAGRMRSACLLGMFLLLFGLHRPGWAQSPPGPSSGATPAQKDQVRLLVREAGSLIDRGDRAGAVAKLKQAQRVYPDPTLSYNLGIAYAEWGKDPEAASAFADFLGAMEDPQGPPKQTVTKDRIEDAKRRLLLYKQSLGRLSVEIPGDKASQGMVLVNSQTVGKTPLVAHYLRPGTHDLRVTLSGCRDYQVALALSPGEERTVTAELVPLSQQVLAPPRLIPVATVNEKVERGPLYKQWWFWVAIGGGVAVAGGLIGAAAAGRFNSIAPGTDLPPVRVAR